MDKQAALQFADTTWEDSIVPQLVDYIRIPAKSPHFDPDWAKHGYIDQAVDLIERWCRAQDIAGLTVEVVRLPGRTPLIYMEIPGQGDDCVLLYGHLDKQPEMTGWSDGLGPWEPVRKGDKLYGRGGADDGYAAFASLTAIRLLQQQGIAHARCVVIIEACEESGSYDLPHYIDHLADRIGDPSLVVCLDSGCGNYDQMWCTTSLRGIASGNLTVEVLTEGVHSGDASGVVPSSFRIVRKLLSRLEDEQSGKVLPDDLHAAIPKERQEQAQKAADTLGDEVYTKFPFVDATTPVSEDLTDLVLNRTWRPALSVTGADGLPPLNNAGNVLRPKTAVKVSLRLPPTVNAERANAALKELFESSPPYNARVSFEPEQAGSGWNAPALAPWLGKSMDAASQAYFGESAMYMGEGGSIPFMGMLGEKFPAAQFLITGVLGPHSNAHGPNEFLHIPTGKKLTCCVAQVLADHLTR
ncbi:MAG: M20 family metallopeptidase [Xanthomonadaceae bacterium]|nr:M20 family metallopeptidase [Xanthomonadaceae bacterium]